MDDAALFIGRFTGGALASFEATRFASGRKNAIRIEINGSGQLGLRLRVDERAAGVRPERTDRSGRLHPVLVTEPEHPYIGAWWPPGHLIGYEHSFTHEIVDLVRGLGAGTDPSPSFADGLQVQQVLAAVEDSAANESRWRSVPGAERTSHAA